MAALEDVRLDSDDYSHWKVLDMLGSRSTMVLAVVAGSLIAGDGALANTYDRYRVVCSAEQQSVINAAIEESKRLVDRTTDVLPPKNSEIGGKFQRWFGGAEGDLDSTVEAIYNGIRTSLVFANTWCPNMSTPDTDPGTLAWVPSDSVNEIFLEASFFQLSTSGADSQAGTIIHEVGHLSFVADVVDSDVTGDGEPDYGVVNAEQLARTQPEIARRTSDNLQYFTEDVVYGIP